MKPNLTSLLLLFVVSGCGRPATPMPSTQAGIELVAIAEQYHQHCSDAGPPPSSAEDMSNYQYSNDNLAGGMARSDAMKAALASGVYTVYWNYDVSAHQPRNGKTILAFHNDVPIKGGLVAFADGLSKSVTKDEFENLAKASDFSNQ